jgi:hypothetical protein
VKRMFIAASFRVTVKAARLIVPSPLAGEGSAGRATVTVG